MTQKFQTIMKKPRITTTVIIAMIAIIALLLCAFADESNVPVTPSFSEPSASVPNSSTVAIPTPSQPATDDNVKNDTSEGDKFSVQDVVIQSPRPASPISDEPWNEEDLSRLQYWDFNMDWILSIKNGYSNPVIKALEMQCTSMNEYCVTFTMPGCPVEFNIGYVGETSISLGDTYTIYVLLGD